MTLAASCASGVVQAQVMREMGDPSSTVAASPVMSYEYRWDVGEPFGYMALGDGDTACVTFPAVANARLDSLRVGLRRVGSIDAGVWSLGHTGSPLRSPLAFPLTVTSTEEPPVPYPVPFPNWIGVDLSSRNIRIDSGFAVAFVCRGDPDSQQRLMIATQPDTPSHSFSFLHSPGAGKPAGWYVVPVHDSSDTSCAFLVRAYVSTLSAVEREGGAGTAARFSLEQNWPNPCNPSTTIGYNIARSREYGVGSRQKAVQVKLVVYDLLGREVATLVDGYQTPGQHSVVFNASTLASGVYVYRLVAGGQALSRKLVLLR